MKLLAFLFYALVFLSAAIAAPRQDLESVKKWRKHYSEHLPEAKEMLRACVATGFNKIQGEGKVKCEAARDAWHFQPYKPAKK